MLTRRNISIVFNYLKRRLGQLSPIVKDRRPAGAEPDVAQPLGESLDHLEAEADAVLAFIFVLRGDARYHTTSWQILRDVFCEHLLRKDSDKK